MKIVTATCVISAMLLCGLLNGQGESTSPLDLAAPGSLQNQPTALEAIVLALEEQTNAFLNTDTTPEIEEAPTPPAIAGAPTYFFVLAPHNQDAKPRRTPPTWQDKRSAIKQIVLSEADTKDPWFKGSTIKNPLRIAFRNTQKHPLDPDACRYALSATLRLAAKTRQQIVDVDYTGVTFKRHPINILKLFPNARRVTLTNTNTVIHIDFDFLFAADSSISSVFGENLAKNYDLRMDGYYYRNPMSGLELRAGRALQRNSLFICPDGTSEPVCPPSS